MNVHACQIEAAVIDNGKAPLNHGVILTSARLGASDSLLFRWAAIASLLPLRSRRSPEGVRKIYAHLGANYPSFCEGKQIECAAARISASVLEMEKPV